MPTSSQRRPWSTQYKDDYNPRSAGWHRKCNTKLVPCMSRPRVPMATPIVTFAPPTYTGRYFGLEDPMLYPSDEEGDSPPRLNPGDMEGELPEVVTDVPGGIDIGLNTEQEPVIPEPTEISREPHWICWPEPKTGSYGSKRPHTSLGFHRETQHGDCGTGHEQLSPKGEPLTYEPDLNSWTNVKDIDRKTVDMYTLQRSQSFYEPTRKPMTSISVNEPPVRDSYSRYGRDQSQGCVDPTGVYRQSFFPYHKAGGHGAREEQVMRMLNSRMEGRQPNAYNYSYAFNKYPLHMRSRRPVSKSEDYVHDQSMFMTTTPRCIGHFIIHPDWVSERSALRRSNTMIMPPKPKASALRY